MRNLISTPSVIVFFLPLYLSACGSFQQSAPTPLPTIVPLPPGFVTLADTDVHLSFALPEGPTRTSGTAPHATYAEYGPPPPDVYPTFRVGADDTAGSHATADQILSGIVSAASAQAGESIEILTEYHDITIEGEPASVVEFYVTVDSTMDFFSILVVTVGPDGRGYVLQWTSPRSTEDDARALFQDMLPHFAFLP